MNVDDCRVGQKVYIDLTEYWGEGYWGVTEVLAGGHIKSDDPKKPPTAIVNPRRAPDGDFVVTKHGGAVEMVDGKATIFTNVKRLEPVPARTIKEGEIMVDVAAKECFYYDHRLDYHRSESLRKANRQESDWFKAQGKCLVKFQ